MTNRPNHEITTNECIDATPGYPWPICHVCGEEVPELSIIFNPEKQHHTWRAKCHGVFEDKIITDELLKQCNDPDIELEPEIVFKNDE